MDVLPILQTPDDHVSPFCIRDDQGFVVYGKTNFNPDNTELHTSSVTGGSYREYLLQLQRRKSVALLLEPLQHRFMLPSWDGQGVPVQLEEMNDLDFSYSADLCCQFHYDAEAPSVILWDNIHSLLQKFAIAEEIGISVLLCDFEIYKKIKTL